MAPAKWHYRRMPENLRDATPCDGSLGRDAEVMVRARGSLIGVRAEVANGFVPLPGRDFRGADLSTSDLTDQRFKKYVFRCASFRLATLADVSFLWCELSWADFRGCMLRGSSFSACDLTHTDFRDADLRYATFGSASGAAGWCGTDLTGAVLDGADLRGSTFRPETVWPDGFDPALAGASLAERGKYR